ncbi:M20/M25/M40 family metallo-hydrolase [Spongiibacter sp. KMU-158]|uniref:M20/M25/M40 family metallo-hydrolase n=1 Tax=Spongiibacter pelagi TaxID=2760804 RepID=A0A927C432_9GAMM|nr:M20 family peptidase [Spongiibacter pelagi]MBD2859482.1 M20/M25/M40 family metallo-hydrolase [Spongiibacter pelagi]
MKKIFLLAVVAVLAVIVVRALQFAPPETMASAKAAPSTPAASTWNADELAEGLASAVRFPTVSNADFSLVNRQAFADFQQFLAQRFPLVFSQLKPQRIKDDTLLLTWEGSDASAQPIILLSHQDVVPVIPGTEAEWTYPPFAGVVADGYIWGRGTADDKAGVMGILEAAERALQEGYMPPRKIYFAFGHDEEVGGAGAIAVAELLEARGERLAFLLDEGGIIAKDMIPGLNARVALIGPGEKGYVSLELSARGDGGHSSMPPRHSAAGVIARAVKRLEDHPFPADLGLTVEFFQFLGNELSFFQKVLLANEWLFGPLIEKIMSQIPALNAGMRTTTAVTMLQGSVKDNVLPITASAVVNFRILPGETIATVIDQVKAIIDDEQVSVAEYGFGSNPSQLSSTDSVGFKVLADVIQDVDPAVIVTPRLVVAATDARHFDKVSDASFRFMGVELGPRELKGIHGTDERVSVASYAQAVDIYYRLILRAGEL